MSETDAENWLQKNIDQLDITGMFSKDKPKRIRLQISIFFLTTYNISTTLDLFLNCKSLENYVEALATYLPAFASLGFLICFIQSRDTFHEVVDILRSNFVLHNRSIKAEIMAIRLVKYSQYYIYFVFLVFLFLAGQSYLERDAENIHDAKRCGLPGRSYYPVDITKPYYFIILFFVQIFTITVVIHITIPIAMFFAGLLIHLRAQLFYLQECLIQVCENQDPEIQRTLLNKCLKYHMLLIHFTDEMQDGFGIILLIHNYSPSIVISVCAYQASLMSVLDPKFMPYFSTMNYVLAECFVYCYYGQHIIDQSEFLGFVAYSNKWYHSAPDIGRDLSLLIMRCQHPLRMKFLGSTNASLETYYNIVKTGYSYFMFLASMGAPNES